MLSRAASLSRDQQVFSYLIASLSHDVLVQVATSVTVAQLWSVLDEIFTSETRARTVNTRITLATTKKGSMTITEYVGKMRSLADEMVMVGKPLGDEELVSYIVTGLDL